MAGTPGCQQPTALLKDHLQPLGMSGLCRKPQWHSSSFGGHCQCCFRAPAPWGTSSGLLWLPSLCQHSETPAKERWEKRWGFISHEGLHPGCTWQCRG